VISMSVCPSVCLHLSGTTLEASHKRSVHVACGLESVHVVTRYVLSVLWMTSFARNWPSKLDNSK